MARGPGVTAVEAEGTGTRPEGGTAAPAASAVRAAARVVAAPDGRGGTALPVLAGDGPIALRRTRAAAPWAEVTMVGAMCAPLGGDRLHLSVRVRDGARLRMGSAAATLALPARRPATGRYAVDLTVEQGGWLHWLPEPLISAAGSDTALLTRVDLAAGGRLALREILVLGRSGEPAGHLTSRLTVSLAGRPLLDQEVACGPGEDGWDGPAVLGPHRAIGHLLVVGPEHAGRPASARVLTGDRSAGEAVLTPLAGPAVLLSALGPDALAVRRLLERGAAELPPDTV